MQSFLWNCAVFVVAFLSFATYSLMDTTASRLTAETAFVSLAIFNNMRSLFRMLPRDDGARERLLWITCCLVQGDPYDLGKGFVDI